MHDVYATQETYALFTPPTRRNSTVLSSAYRAVWSAH